MCDSPTPGRGDDNKLSRFGIGPAARSNCEFSSFENFRERIIILPMGRRGPKSAAELMAIAQNRRANVSDYAASPVQLPAHLVEETRDWWLAIAPRLEPHQLRILTCAAEAWDLKEAAQQVLAKFGLSYTDRKGQIRARPEAAIARDSRAAFIRCLHELRLDVPPPKPRENGGLGVTWRDLAP